MPAFTSAALLLYRRLRLVLLLALVAAVLVALLLNAGADAHPMLDPCTYERPVCPTYAPR